MNTHLVDLLLISACEEKLTAVLNKHREALTKKEVSVFQKGIDALKGCNLNIQLNKKDADTFSDEARLNEILFSLYNDFKGARLNAELTKECRELASELSVAMSNFISAHLLLNSQLGEIDENESR